MQTKYVAVIMGGPSAEHDTSLKTGANMVAALDKAGYKTISLLLDKDDLFYKDGVGKNGGQTLDQVCDELIGLKATVLIALHGTFGEDGTLQAVLERYKLPYAGSKVATSVLAMNKAVSSAFYRRTDLSTPSSVVLSDISPESIHKALAEQPLPVIVKPASQGSSLGISLVKHPEEFAGSLKKAFEYDGQVIVQEYIEGREFSCGVLQDGEVLKALPPTELIMTKSDFFDFKAKYSVGGTKEVTPAQVPKELTDKLQAVAKKAHLALGCSDYSRTDMIVKNNETYVIETNTLPGLTDTSLFPQQMKAAGMTMTDLMEFLVKAANRKENND